MRSIAEGEGLSQSFIHALGQFNQTAKRGIRPGFVKGYFTKPVFVTLRKARLFVLQWLTN